jgi:ribosomal protein S18 acetylase RimI-like enzyme
MTDRAERAIAFQRSMNAALAERTVPTKHGVAYFADSLPRVWDRNLVAVELGAQASAAELALEAEAVQSAARLRHRKITVDDELGFRLARDFRRRGWTVHEYVVMPLAGDLAELDLSATGEIDADRLAPVWRQGIRAYTPDDETVRQLVAAQRDRTRAVDVRYFAAFADGQIAAYCELFAADGVGQVESVMCLEEFRGRGLGKAVTARAAAESVAAGHELTFLVAEADDWPRHLYERLGFHEEARIWDFVRDAR